MSERTTIYRCNRMGRWRKVKQELIKKYSNSVLSYKSSTFVYKLSTGPYSNYQYGHHHVHFTFHITTKRHKALVFHQYPIGKFRLPDKAKGSTPKTPGGPKGVRHPNRVETFASINFRFPKIIQKIPRSVRLLRPIDEPRES